MTENSFVAAVYPRYARGSRLAEACGVARVGEAGDRREGEKRRSPRKLSGQISCGMALVCFWRIKIYLDLGFWNLDFYHHHHLK